MAAEKNQQIAVIGAVAYDQIATTPTLIADRQAPLLNCKLTSLTEAFGGCGGNIAYNLAGLGSHPLLITCTGKVDDERYLAHCTNQGIPTGAFLRVPDTHSARAIVITDPQGKQFTGFFPGPTPTPTQWRKHLSNLDCTAISVWVQAPYPAELMQVSLEYAASLPQSPLRIWCPGQYADLLDREQITALTRQSDWIIGNAHELAHLESAEFLLRDKTQDKMREKLRVTTNGAQPVRVDYPDGTTSTHPVTSNGSAKDPTGCGDAFLAGVAHHVAGKTCDNWRSVLPQAITAANDAAAACLMHAGGQNHSVREH